MDQRRPGGDHDAFAEHTDDVLFDTDVFLTELSKGHDPSEGEDPLAQLLLSFNDEVIYSRAPEPPTIDNAFMGRFDAATEIFEPVTDAASLLIISKVERSTLTALSRQNQRIRLTITTVL